MKEQEFIFKERLMPEDMIIDDGEKDKHLQRYEFAGNYVKGKDVLDIACGIGYGSYILSQSAQNVVGIDKDGKTIEYARRKYKKENLNFISLDAEKICSYINETFDVIISYETIEHVDNPGKFIASLYKLLRKSGTFILSVPNGLIDEYSSSLHHKHFFRLRTLKRILKDKFKVEEIYYQYPFKLNKRAILYLSLIHI